VKILLNISTKETEESLKAQHKQQEHSRKLLFAFCYFLAHVNISLPDLEKKKF